VTTPTFELGHSCAVSQLGMGNIGRYGGFKYLREDLASMCFSIGDSFNFTIINKSENIISCPNNSSLVELHFLKRETTLTNKLQLLYLGIYLLDQEFLKNF